MKSAKVLHHGSSPILACAAMHKHRLGQLLKPCLGLPELILGDRRPFMVADGQVPDIKTRLLIMRQQTSRKRLFIEHKVAFIQQAQDRSRTCLACDVDP